MAEPTTNRKDQYAVNVSVDGTKLGVFDVMTGGDADTTEVVYKPGGMVPQISLGGIVTIAQVVLSRLYDLARDHDNMPWLLSRVGKGNVVITKQPLDVDGNAYGKPLTYGGTLKRVTPPPVDSNTPDAAILELEVTPAGTIT